VPTISVLLPVRDAGAWLAPSLASLRRQTFADFEVIAIDDGSTDGSGDALERAAARDRRLRVVHTTARGLPAALNTALGLARGRLIARHDADDLSHRRRFELQHAHLETHPRTTALGTRLRLFPAGAIGPGMRRWEAWHNALLDHDAMARDALIDSPLAHGTAVVSRAALERIGGWRERGWPEDVDLWLRLIGDGARLAKLPVTLYAWRRHRGSATHRDPRYTRDRYDALRVDALERGPLRGARSVTVVGVGASLARWQGLLSGRGWRTEPVAAGRPSPAAVRRMTTPVVLVFGAPPARERWRQALATAGVDERQVVYVA